MELVKLFVGGFPLQIDELELAKLFAPHGDISTIKIVRDKKTRICKGYAFIEMNDRAGAEAATEALNGTEMNGKPLSVNITQEKPQAAAIRSNYSTSKGAFEANRPNEVERTKRPRRPRI